MAQSRRWSTKAENAIARLDKAQSTEEFTAALKDLRDVVERGLKITRGESVPDAPLASNEAGGGRRPPRGAVQDGYRYKGGNPADPKSWEKL